MELPAPRGSESKSELRGFHENAYLAAVDRVDGIHLQTARTLHPLKVQYFDHQSCSKHSHCVYGRDHGGFQRSDHQAPY